MEIRVLRYFLTVVREEGINRAAEVLHITQPTLSRQLSQLEDELGVKLFNRGARKISLTSEGILLRRRAEEILSLVDRTEKELIEQDEQVEGRIAIGGGVLSAMQVLPELIARFRESYPLVGFDIYTGNADLVKEQMEKGLIDIGVLLEPIDIEKFDFIRLEGRERLVVLMRPDDPLAKKPGITAKDLKGKPLCLPMRGNVQNEIINWLGSSYDERIVLFTSNFASNTALMVQHSLAYSITVEGSIPFMDEAKIASRPCVPELRASSVFAWKKQQPFTPATAKFIQHIKCFLSIGEV